MKHVKSLDGVRGLAVLLVMFFHLNIAGFSLGWSGVPLFFVLSGFLITQLLLDAKTDRLRDYLRIFYLRRSLRIFPLFYLYLVVNWVAVLASGHSSAGYIWYPFYLQNYHIGLDIRGVPGLLGHTWSLAVEEQFYLLWPLLVYFLDRRRLIWTCLAFIVIAPVVRLAIYLQSGNVYLENVTLPSCIDMLAYGSLLASIRSSTAGSKVVCWGLLVGGVALAYAIATLGLGAFWKPESWAGEAFYMFTALGLIFGGLIWFVAVAPSSGLARPFENGALVFTGKISYGLYIWHPACFLAAEKLAKRWPTEFSPVARWALALVAAYLVATLSYYLFERYFLRIKDRMLGANG